MCVGATGLVGTVIDFFGAGTDLCKANCDHVENFGCVTPMRCQELYTATAGMCVKEFKRVS